MPATQRFEGDLTDGERFWVELQPWLRNAGYELRPRYHPGWTPSWLPGGDNVGRPSLLCEDGVCNPRDNVLDAVRVSDGAPVTMKAIKSVFEDEISHIQFLSSKKLRADSANHCVALLDVLHPPSGQEAATATTIMVFPRLVPWDVFPFAKVCEALDFFGQVLEGLAFMHKHNLAHCDASWGNVMMDGLHLFLEPPHPSRPSLPLCGDPRPALHVGRSATDKPARYYFIDFGLSVRFASTGERQKVHGPPGQDRSAPELHTDAPYDPFALDVYCVGNLLLVHWLNAYSNVEFIRPLALAMMQPDPSARPTAAEALARFNTLRRAIPPKARAVGLKCVKGYDWQEYVRGNVSARVPRAGFFERILSVQRRTAKAPRRKDKTPHANKLVGVTPAA